MRAVAFFLFASGTVSGALAFTPSDAVEAGKNLDGMSDRGLFLVAVVLIIGSAALALRWFMVRDERREKESAEKQEAIHAQLVSAQDRYIDHLEDLATKTSVALHAAAEVIADSNDLTAKSNQISEATNRVLAQVQDVIKATDRRGT